jgi:hypothetical protein
MMINIIIKESQIKVKLDYNKTRENICKWNVGNERIYNENL